MRKTTKSLEDREEERLVYLLHFCPDSCPAFTLHFCSVGVHHHSSLWMLPQLSPLSVHEEAIPSLCLFRWQSFLLAVAYP